MNVLQPFIWFLPAYVSNASATFSRFLSRRHPIDGRAKLWNSRLLGDGKTWEGVVIGVVAGTVTGAVVGDLVVGFLLSVGAVVGDIIGSFVKRRAGLQRGEEAPLLDQLDFVIGALLVVPPPPDWAVLIVAATPIIHRVANWVAHLWGVKREPW